MTPDESDALGYQARIRQLEAQVEKLKVDAAHAWSIVEDTADGRVQMLMVDNARCGHMVRDLESELRRLRRMEDLLESGCLFIAVNTNDFFAPAADCEEVWFEDLHVISRLYETHEDLGPLAWAAVKTGCQPWRMERLDKDKWQAALDAAREGFKEMRE